MRHHSVYDQDEPIWSLSRHYIFHRCQREYYYHYHGAQGGWRADVDPRRQILHRLKQLRRIRTWIEQVVQRVIQENLEDYGIYRHLPKAGKLLSRLQYHVDRDWQDCRREQWRSDAKTLNLFEIHYRQDSQWVAIERENCLKQARTCLRNFADSDLLECMHKNHSSLQAINLLDTFTCNDQKLYCLIDLAFNDSDHLLNLIEWRLHKAADPLPRRLYLAALYARRRWHTPFEMMRLQQVPLYDSSTPVPVPIHHRSILEFQDTILQSMVKIASKEMDKEDDFSYSGDHGICRACRFHGDCPYAQQSRQD